MARQDRNGGGFTSFRDMIDGGGAGRSGDRFEDGPLSGLLNALGKGGLHSGRALASTPWPAFGPRKNGPDEGLKRI